MLTLQDLNLPDNDENRRALLAVNAYIANKGVPKMQSVPEAVRQAARELYLAFIDGKLYGGRTEAQVLSKSVNAGGVSVSKTFAVDESAQPISHEQMLADALLAPFISKGGVMAAVGRY